MADLGDIGVGLARAVLSASVFGDRAVASIAGAGADPGARVVVVLRGRAVASVMADSAGDWTVGGLNNGTYWAAEVGALRAWLIEVDGATVTVTPQTGGGGGSTIIAGFAAAYLS
jgi:hypothetical protein